jgi:hypothetical protein
VFSASSATTICGGLTNIKMGDETIVAAILNITSALGKFEFSKGCISIGG